MRFSRPSFSVGRVVRTRHILRALHSIGPGPLHMLDAGCGDGFVVGRIAQTYPAWQIVALEPDCAAAETARARLDGLPGVRVVDGEIGGRGLASTFDLVLCMDVMEHLRQDRNGLQWLADHVAPNGRLVLHVPSARQEHWSRQVREAMRREVDAGLGPHFREGYEREQLKALVEDAGMIVDDIAWTFHRVPTRWAVDLDQLLYLKRRRAIKVMLLPLLVGLSSVERDTSHTCRGHGLLLVARPDRS